MPGFITQAPVNRFALYVQTRPPDIPPNDLDVRDVGVRGVVKPHHKFPALHIQTGDVGIAFKSKQHIPLGFRLIYQPLSGFK
ncbi:hypothetical protein GCM10010970_32320 [Silvimonas iriomotensis]|uniref:Uncharacterized protein n=1 Tax=Silvimonas iriomotensis TaxID=449662 RepID=A0ABQ2PCI1_9NEIS|nr:hypothetical protein GCM10010970_32320 [Silvimonas iriomotensis]